MNIDELIKYLDACINKDLILILEGIVSMKIKIEKAKIEYDENYIIVENDENNLQKIKFNLHQLMKASKQNENIILEFDQLQKVNLTIKEEVS